LVAVTALAAVSVSLTAVARVGLDMPPSLSKSTAFKVLVPTRFRLAPPSREMLEVAAI